MKKIFLAAVLAVSALSLSAQDELGSILAGIEANNAKLTALRKLRDARTVEARVGNGLADPEVEFEYKWGNPSSIGKSGEVVVSQPFDFPTVYAHRGKLAKLRAEKYGYEYQAARQELLLEAQTLYIEAVSLKRTTGVLEYLAQNAQEIVGAYSKKIEAGDANILEVNEANFALIGHDNALEMARIELRAALERLVGLNGGQTVTIGANDFGELPALDELGEILAEYNDMSPELKALTAEKRVAERDVKLSRAQSLPRLSAGYKHEFGDGERFNGLTVGMSIPMFGNRHNVKRARAQGEYAEASFASAALDLQTDLRREYAQAQAMRGSLARYESMLDLELAVSLARKALDAGRIGITEYYAQIQLAYEAHLTILELQRDYLLAYARLNMIRF